MTRHNKRFPYSVEGLARRFIAAAHNDLTPARLAELIRSTDGVGAVHGIPTDLRGIVLSSFVDMARHEPTDARYVEMIAEAFEVACLWGWTDGAEIEQPAVLVLA